MNPLYPIFFFLGAVFGVLCTLMFIRQDKEEMAGSSDVDRPIQGQDVPTEHQMEGCFCGAVEHHRCRLDGAHPNIRQLCLCPCDLCRNGEEETVNSDSL